MTTTPKAASMNRDEAIKLAKDLQAIYLKWRAWAAPIPDHPGYYASECGSVFSTVNGAPRKLKGSMSSRYQSISLKMPDGSRRRLYVHRLVWSTYFKDGCDGLVVRHLDDDKTNNHLSNLMAGTNAENYQDRVRNFGHGTEGEHHGGARLTNDAVIDILNNYEPNKVPLRVFAEKYNVSEGAIHSVVHGKTWTHINRDEVKR